MRQDSHIIHIISLLDVQQNILRIEQRRGLVDHDGHVGHFQGAGHLHRNSGSLIILMVGPHDDHEGMGNGDRKKRLFVQARVGIDQKHVEGQFIDKFAEPAGQKRDVVAFAQDVDDLVGPSA